MELLKCDRVSKVYGSGQNQVTALDRIDLSVDRGEFVAITGASGSGKSTLLHILGTVDKPTEGKVTVEGVDLASLNQTQSAIFRRRKAGLVYQFYNLVPVLNVVENITLPVALDGRPVNKQRLADLVARLGLRGREGHLPSQLSGGQQQRVAIGRALMNAPSVVLADEPTGNLDSKNSAEIMQLLRDSNREMGQTMLVITHSEEIALAADRIVAIEDGRIVRDERIRR